MSMKTLGAILLSMLFLSFCYAQEKPDELQKVKDALVVQVIKTQDMEKQYANLTAYLNKVGEDLKAVKTIAQLDSLKSIYGLKESKDIPKK